MLRRIALKSFGGIVAVALVTCIYTLALTRVGPVDPGVRGGPAGAGTPLKGLTADETAFFQDGLARFAQIEAVTKGRITASVPASTQTSVSLATRSRMRADRARCETPCSKLPA